MHLMEKKQGKSDIKNRTELFHELFKRNNPSTIMINLQLQYQKLEEQLEYIQTYIQSIELQKNMN